MATYEDIAKVNDAMKLTPIKGKKYAEVPQRVTAFRKLYPNGSITSEIISLMDGVCVMKATVCDDAGNILGTGHAYEKEGSSFINDDSYIENCETSAWGRALAACGFNGGTSIASYEEVSNAQLQQENRQKKPTKAPREEQPQDDPKIGEEQLRLLRGYADEVGISAAQICATYHVDSLPELTMTQYRHATMLLEQEEAKKKGQVQK